MHLRQHAFPLRSRGLKLFEEGFYQLTQQLEINLFQDMNCCMINTFRNMYRDILDDLCVTNPDSYTSFKLKSKLLHHCGNIVAILDQSGQASGFICAASVPLCDALAMLKQEDGVLIPSEMTHNPSTPHVFAIDNLDWVNKTLEGGSFHATTAIIIEQQDTEHQTSTVSVLSKSTRRRTLDDVQEKTSTHQYFVGAKEKQKGRSLHNLPYVDNLFSHCDDIAKDLLLVWRLGRSVRESLVYADGQLEYGVGLPGFTAFCARLCLTQIQQC